MSGTPKRGLDYAGWSTDIFDNETNPIDGLLGEYGWDGFGVYFFLCQRAFGTNGYYYEWQFENAPSTARKMGCGITAETVRAAVSLCLELDLFDKAAFENYGILTNRMIQERFMYAVDKRKPSGRTVDEKYWLLTSEETKSYIQFIGKSDAEAACEHSQGANSHSLSANSHSLPANATKERTGKDRKGQDRTVQAVAHGCAALTAAAPPSPHSLENNPALNCGVIGNNADLGAMLNAIGAIGAISANNANNAGSCGSYGQNGETGEISDNCENGGAFPEKCDSNAAASRKASGKNNVTEKMLNEKYGKSNVSEYIQRFEKWKARKGVNARLDKWAIIQKWLEEDGVTKPPPSSFDLDDVMESIKQRYNNS